MARARVLRLEDQGCARGRSADAAPLSRAGEGGAGKGPLTQPFTGQSLRVLIEDLKEKAARVRDLPPPSARHPERFHLERDEIARELAAWATHLERRL